MTRPRIVCLVGPTASGKTALALALAEGFAGEIVSADSRQVYRRLDIGTAKPTAAEQGRVRHHCLDLVEPTEGFDVARFREAAASAIADIHGRGRVPFVVGGTGLWVRALLHGLCPAPPRVAAVRAELEARARRAGWPVLHAELATVDPRMAARLHPHDGVRIVRALEVAITSGRSLSSWQGAHGFRDAPFDALVVGLITEPGALSARIGDRVERMLREGWLEEVAALVAEGLTDDAPAWRTVGYRELRAVVRNAAPLDVARSAIAQATRQFAGRQRTWFRREPEVIWRDAAGQRSLLEREITAFLETPPRPGHTA